MTRITRDDLASLSLSIGNHDEMEGAACVMEYHTVRRGLPWSDEPADVSPVIRAFAVRLNDTTALEGADVRSRLLEMERAGRFDDTASADAAVEMRRAYIAADWAVRECAPLRLRAAGLPEWADRLASLAPIVDGDTAAYRAADAAYRAADAAYRAAAADAAAARAAAAYAADEAETRRASFDSAFACLERMLAVAAN